MVHDILNRKIKCFRITYKVKNLHYLWGNAKN